MKLTVTYILAMLFQGCYVWTQDIGDSLILIERFIVNYDVDEYLLTEYHDSLLSSLFNYQNTKELEFYIDSYTDSDGSNIYNDELSDRRGKSIATWLINHGIKENRIHYQGHGEPDAIVEDSKDTKAANRRSEIRIYQKAEYKMFQGVVDVDNSDELRDLEITINDDGIKRKIHIEDGSEFSFPVPLERSVELEFAAKDHFPLIRQVKLSPRAKVDHVLIYIKEINR